MTEFRDIVGPATVNKGTDVKLYDTSSDLPSASTFGVGLAQAIDTGSISVSNSHVFTDIAQPKNSDLVVPFGDSITAQMWKQLSLTGSITVSNGIATCTSSSAHLTTEGSNVKIILASYSGFNGIKTVLSVPSSTTFTFAVDAGAPASEAIVSHVAYFESDQNFTPNFVNYLKAYSKQRFYTPHNGGVGGDDSSEARLRVFTDCVAYAPGRAIILLGTNNMINATSNDITTFIDDMTFIYQACLSAGIAVDACTIPPLGSGHASVSNIINVGWLMKANRWIRDYAKQTRGMRCHDIYAWLTDPAQANGQALSGMLSDTVHPNTALGAMTIGKNMAANYAEWLGAPASRLPASQADGYSFDSASKNRWTNHTLQGAGPIATGWSIALTGAGNAKTDTVVARTVADDGDIAGNNQVTTVNTAAAAGSHLLYRDPTAQLTAGKTYIARGNVRISLAGGSMTVAEITIGFTAGGITRTIRSGLGGVLEDGSYEFETAPFVFPSGASSPLFYMKCYIGIGGNPVIRWGRLDLEQQD